VRFQLSAWVQWTQRSLGRCAAFDRPQSSVKTCTVAFELFGKHAREARINSEFPTFGLGLFKKAMAAGHGEEEVAALIKAFRANG
jgi:3-hydroxyisobutyrate dehydrogenase-like beta-hydroxyacid dehydrogenase